MDEFAKKLHARAEEVAESCDPRDREKISAALPASKGDVPRFNAVLSEFARDRRFAAALLAMDAFLQLQQRKTKKKNRLLPTAHTVAAFVNACAGGGDADFALAMVRGAPPGTVGVVAHTALVKALVGCGRLSEARGVVASLMPAQGPDAPNVRTFHALLRGALRLGDADAARDALQRMRASAASSVDATALEYAARTLLAAGAADEALALAAELDRLPGGPLPSTVAATRVALARALALGGRAADARKSLDAARMALASPPAAMASAGAGGISASVRNFNEHQRRELRREAEAVQAFLDSPAMMHGRTRDSPCFRVCPRVVVAPPAGPRQPSDAEWHAAVSAASTRTGGSGSGSGRQQRKLRVELCSGSGEWVVQHAIDDGDNVAWIAVEILHDRAYSIWTRASMAGVDTRLAVLCADALDVLRHAFEDGSVDEIYVNFPEPAPVGTTHFLHTPAFAAAARNALTLSGRLVLVTDNRSLAQNAARVFSEVAFFGSVLSGNELPVGFGESSSYFDRLWATGNRLERHVVQAIKI